MLFSYIFSYPENVFVVFYSTFFFQSGEAPVRATTRRNQGYAVRWRMVSHDVQVHGREACQDGGISQPLQRKSGVGWQAIVQNIPAIAY